MTVSDAWEALTGDPLPWLLDPERPNLHWRVLVDLVGRPLDSPAVMRARGGANANEPVASLLRDLRPDGTWVGDPALWKVYSGPGWRLIAAVQWGADPTDPRLQAAAEMVVETSHGEGGFSRSEHRRASPWLTARLLQTLAVLGWCRHGRFQEALAWLEEGEGLHALGGWSVVDRGPTSRECAVTAVAVLDALTTCEDQRRHDLRARAIESLVRALEASGGRRAPLGHPCLGRTDDAEILSTLAKASVSWRRVMDTALTTLQHRQLEGGRWRREVGVAESLPAHSSLSLERPCRWVTLKCVVALMDYAVDAQLPRMYPHPPPAQ